MCYYAAGLKLFDLSLTLGRPPLCLVLVSVLQHYFSEESFPSFIGHHQGQKKEPTIETKEPWMGLSAFPGVLNTSTPRSLAILNCLEFHQMYRNDGVHTPFFLKLASITVLINKNT
jgi:hypothetical protein